MRRTLLIAGVGATPDREVTGASGQTSDPHGFAPRVDGEAGPALLRAASVPKSGAVTPQTQPIRAARGPLRNVRDVSRKAGYTGGCREGASACSQQVPRFR